MTENKSVAILIPCYNEELTIGKVIDDFKKQLPNATIYVFDNCSTDKTIEIAKSRGATIHKEPRQGKGYVIERMFDIIHADYYIMVDGDDTYPVNRIHDLLEPVVNGDADMAVGARLAQYGSGSFRPLHVAGNNLVKCLINGIFRSNLKDIMSGYRVFNRRATTRIPIVSAGFDVETEITIRALYYGIKIVERDIEYGERPTGSLSKLHTFHDGAKVLWRLFSLFRSFKPLTFFGSIGIILILCSLVSGYMPLYDYFTLGSVNHVPLAILAASIAVLSSVFIFLGITLNAQNLKFRELHNILLRGKD